MYRVDIPPRPKIKTSFSLHIISSGSIKNSNDNSHRVFEYTQRKVEDNHLTCIEKNSGASKCTPSNSIPTIQHYKVAQQIEHELASMENQKNSRTQQACNLYFHKFTPRATDGSGLAYCWKTRKIHRAAQSLHFRQLIYAQKLMNAWKHTVFM